MGVAGTPGTKEEGAMERKFVGAVGLLVAIALLVAGFCIAVPDKYIDN